MKEDGQTPYTSWRIRFAPFVPTTHGKVLSVVIVVSLAFACVFVVALAVRRARESLDDALADLSSRDEQVAASAVQQLVEIGAPAVNALVIKLECAHFDMARQLAAEALGRIGDTRAVDPLVRALRAPAGPAGYWPGTKQAAATALGEIRDVRAIPALTESLDSYEVRTSAANALASFGERAVKPLVDALGDARLDVREGVGAALCRIGPQAVPALIAALSDNGREHKHREVCEVLASIGDKRAVEPLAAVLRDPTFRFRPVAAEALGKLEDGRAVPALIMALGDENEIVGLHAAEALGKLGEVAIGSIVSALKDSDARVRCRAASALGYSKVARVIPPLAERLRDTEADVRAAAATALGGISDAASVEPLISALLDENGEVRAAAARALGENAASAGAAGPVLLRALEDEQENARAAAATALGAIQHSAAIEPLIARLRDGCVSVHTASAHALGDLDSVRAIPGLVVLLNDECESVRGAASIALGRIGPLAAPVLVEAVRSTHGAGRRYATIALGLTGDSLAVRPLVALLEDWRGADIDVFEALKALGNIDNIHSAEALVAFLAREPNDSVAKVAADSLAMLGDTALWPLLSELKAIDLEEIRGIERQRGTRARRDKSAERRIKESLAVIGEFAVPPLIEPLIETSSWLDKAESVPIRGVHALKVHEDTVRQLMKPHVFWMDALAGMGQPAVGDLLPLLHRPSRNLRCAVAKILGDIGDRRGIEPLVALLKDGDAQIRSAAAEALGKSGDRRAVDPLIAALRDDDTWVRRQAAEALGMILDRRAVRPLISTLEDENRSVRRQAAVSLGWIGHRCSVRALIGALDDPDTEVRTAAQEALRQLGSSR